MYYITLCGNPAKTEKHVQANEAETGFSAYYNGPSDFLKMRAEGLDYQHQKKDANTRVVNLIHTP
jgi:hypothetical protein